jgi:cyclophilin family peptidyl-prolyl cis-trans isomerase
MIPLSSLDRSSTDGKHVVFGKVISGQSVVSAIEQVGSDSGRTRVPGKLFK